MDATTERMRRAWAPACRSRLVRFAFRSGAAVMVDARTPAAWAELDRAFSRWGYEPRAGETWGQNCRRITGGKGYSLHAYGIAVDVNALTNPYGPKLRTDMPAGMVRDVEAVRTTDGAPVFRWGGRYAGHKDAMHFELVCTPAELARGVAPLVRPPKTEEVKVRPGFDPPIQVVAECDTPDHTGTLQLTADGGVRTLASAPFLGSPLDERTRAAWGKRQPARIDTEDRHDTKLGWGYVVTATTGETYHFPA